MITSYVLTQIAAALSIVPEGIVRLMESIVRFQVMAVLMALPVFIYWTYESRVQKRASSDSYVEIPLDWTYALDWPRFTSGTSNWKEFGKVKRIHIREEIPTDVVFGAQEMMDEKNQIAAAISEDKEDLYFCCLTGKKVMLPAETFIQLTKLQSVSGMKRLHNVGHWQLIQVVLVLRAFLRGDLLELSVPVSQEG